MNSWKIVSDDDDDDFDDDNDDDDDDTSWNLGQNRRRRRRRRSALFSHYVDSDILKIAFFRVWLLIKDLWRAGDCHAICRSTVCVFIMCIRACTYVRV